MHWSSSIVCQCFSSLPARRKHEDTALQETILRLPCSTFPFHSIQEHAMTRRSLSALFQNVSVLLLVCVVLVVAGCGGGGGGGGAPPVLIPLKTATIRTMVPGDTWHYSAAGQLTDDKGQHSITATVIVDILPTIIQSPVTSDNCLDQRTTITVFGLPSTEDHLYFNQDAFGTIRSFGDIDDFGQDIWIVIPPTGYFIATASPMAVGNSNSADVTFTDLTSLSYSYSVTSIDNVATPVGYYESFKMTESSTYQYPDGYEEVVESTVWYVPGLGVIKVQSIDSLYSGGVLQSSLSYTATIDSTSIVY
jgi:hypothetical protein